MLRLWVAILFDQHLLGKCSPVVMFERCKSSCVALSALCTEVTCFPRLNKRRTTIVSSTRCDMSLFLQVIFVYCWVFYLKQHCMLSCIYPCLMHQLRRAQTVKLQAKYVTACMRVWSLAKQIDKTTYHTNTYRPMQ